MMNFFGCAKSIAAFAIFPLSGALILAGCDHTTESLKRPNMTALSPRLQPLFDKTKTVCFGNFVVGIPSSATFVYGPSDVGMPIEFLPGEGDNVAEHVATRLGEVEKDRRFLDKNDIVTLSMFGKVVDGVVAGHKLVFGSNDHATYSIDSFIPVGRDLFIQHAGTAVSKDKALKTLNSVASNLRLRGENEVPTEPGPCIEGGFVSWRPEFERASLGVRLKEFPDVHFSIEVVKNQNYLVESSELEPRLKGAEKDAGSGYSRIKFFRRGPRDLGNWKGSEALARMPAQKDGAESHQFVFVSLGALHDPLQPSLDVQLDTGVSDDRSAAIKPSLTDEEAVALWDRLISSIRVRPTGDAAKHSTALPPTTPLGEFVDSGSKCPQTGWWQCSDIGEVAGGRRRHFAAEESMPHAVLLGKANAWQKLVGQRPTQLIATSWQLMAYDHMQDAPDAKEGPNSWTHKKNLPHEKDDR